MRGLEVPPGTGSPLHRHNFRDMTQKHPFLDLISAWVQYACTVFHSPAKGPGSLHLH